MDLNEKIAARRRQLEEEAAQTNAAHERQRQAEKAARESLKDNPDFNARVEAEVQRRMNEMGMGKGQSGSDFIQTTAEEAVKIRVDSAVIQLAEKRAWDTHGWVLILLSLCGVGCFFYSWVLGIIVLVGAGWLYHAAVEKHKKAIRRDGSPLVRNVSEAAATPMNAEKPMPQEREPEAPRPDPLKCPVCSKGVSAVDSRCPSCFSLLS